jgi:hypothetical protein
MYFSDGREERCVKVLQGKTKKRGNLEDFGVRERIILRRVLKKSYFADLVQDRDRWRGFVNAFSGLRFLFL